jgi:dihydrodipicolinate synthase/N-acetylneuraminate lyase
MLRGCLAAAATPLKDDGSALDEPAFAPYVAWLARHGVDGVLALGTTGEGLLLSIAERKRAIETFVDAARDVPGAKFAVAAHCGAMTTRETCELAAHAAAAGADAIAVIGPPFFIFDRDALLTHFAAAAHRCAPTPFYAYELASRTGYGLSLELLLRLRDAAPNFRGLKVSNPTWAEVEPFLGASLGLDVFIGAEGLIARGLAAGAKGAVSGLAAAYPDLVSAHVRAPDDAGSARLAARRASLNAFPFQAAIKEALRMRGVAIRADVRPPLRRLREDEVRTLREAWPAGG